jgi:nucleoside-diphosphate-sugar epimerase
MSEQVALITGATGFMGSRLAARLLDEDWTVHCILKSDDVLGASRLDPRVAAHVHDGTTADMIRIVALARPTVVFHLASLFLARHRSEDVRGLIESNVLLGTQILEAMSGAGCSRLVNTGTAWQHYHTADYRPVCLYAATKQAFEDICRFYCDANGISVLTIKLNDTYGPGDPRPKIVPLLMDAARTGAPLPMSPGEQTLDLVYVDDIITAFAGAARLLLSGAVTGIADFGLPSGCPITLRDLVATVEGVSGSTIAAAFGALPYREREVMTPWLVGTPLPGWTHAVTLTEGLRRTWEAARD